MTLLRADRVRETSVTPGTGTFSLRGAVSGYLTCVAGIGTTKRMKYCAIARDGSGWEAGIGTVTSGSPDTLSRDIFLDSSTGSAVSFNGSVLDIICTEVAGHSTAVVGPGWLTITKPADQNVTNSVTLTNDTDLLFPLLVNVNYRWRLFVAFDTTAAGDIKFDWNGPASPTSVRTLWWGLAAGAAAFGAVIGDAAFAQAHILTGTGTVAGFVKAEGIIKNGANAGTANFRFAQNTQTADAGVTVLKGSWLEFEVMD